MDDNNPEQEEKVLIKCRKLYEALKDNNSDFSLEQRAGMVKYLEKITVPSYFYFEKNGKRSTKKRAKGFRDKKHFFEHVGQFLNDEAERLLEFEELE